MTPEFDSSPVLRLKVTGRCNRRCCFCHQEGGMAGLSDMLPTRSLVEGLSGVARGLGIGRASITGGEPLLAEDLCGLLSSLGSCAGLTRFSLTTNGTLPLSYEQWASMASCGLDRVNISISDLLEYTDCDTLGGRWPQLPLKNVGSVFASQLWNLRVLHKLEVPVDINVVVFNDYQNTSNVLGRLLAMRDERSAFRIMLLPDLSSGEAYMRSICVIERLCKERGMRRVSAGRRKLSSGGVVAYEADGERVYVKSTMLDVETGGRARNPFVLQSVCAGCPRLRAGECLEGFYGIRVEMRGGTPWVRLCLHRGNDPRLLVPLEEFCDTAAYAELRSMRRRGSTTG